MLNPKDKPSMEKKTGLAMQVCSVSGMIPVDAVTILPHAHGHFRSFCLKVNTSVLTVERRRFGLT